MTCSTGMGRKYGWRGAAVGLALIAAPAAGAMASAPPTDTTSAHGTQLTPPPKICRPMPPRMGSHIKRPRQCRTAAEWTESEQADALRPPLPTKVPQAEPGQRPRPQ